MIAGNRSCNPENSNPFTKYTTNNGSNSTAVFDSFTNLQDLQTILESHSTSGSTSVASSYAILLLRSAALFSTRAALFSTLHGETRQLYGVSKETRHGETPVASLERCHLTASARTKNVLGFFSSLVGQG